MSSWREKTIVRGVMISRTCFTSSERMFLMAFSSYCWMRPVWRERLVIARMSSSVAEGPLWGEATRRVNMLENQMNGLKMRTISRRGRAMPLATPQAWATATVFSMMWTLSPAVG